MGFICKGERRSIRSLTVASNTSYQLLPIPRPRDPDSACASLEETVLTRSRGIAAGSPGFAGGWVARFAVQKGFLVFEFFFKQLFFFLFVLFIFVTAAGIIRASSFHHTQCHFDDHTEPNDAQHLQHEQQTQEH